MKTIANFSDAVTTSRSAVTFRDRIPHDTSSDPLSSEITLIYNEQQRHKFGNTSLQSNVTHDKLSNSSQHDGNNANTRTLLGNKIASSKNINDKVENFSHADQHVNYSDASKRTHVNNISNNKHMSSEHKTHSNNISGKYVAPEDPRHTENKMKHITSNNKREETRTEVENFIHGLKYTSIIDEDSVASETENTYNIGSYVNKKPTQDNMEIINSGRDLLFNREDRVHISALGEGMNAFHSNYKREIGPQTSSYESPSALHEPFSPPSRPAIYPYRHTPPRKSYGLTHDDSHGSATSYYSLSFNSPYKSPSTSYILKPTDFLGSSSALYSSVASSPNRPPAVLYDSPPQIMTSSSHSSPSRKPPSVSPSRKPPIIFHSPPPREPHIVLHDSQPYRLSTLYKPPYIDLHQSLSTLHYTQLSPLYGSAPEKTPKPSYNAQSSEPHGSLTLSYSSSSHGPKPPSISESSLSHKPSRLSHSSPPKKPSIPSYSLQSGSLYESPTSPHSPSHASRPSTSDSSPSHKSRRPPYGSLQTSLYPSQSSEVYESQPSPYSSSSHDSRPHISDSSTHVPHRPSYSSSSQISHRPSSESESSELYESPTSPYSSTHDSKPLSISGSTLPYRPSRPLHTSPPKRSHRPSYGSDSTDSHESSSSHYSSTHDSRPSSISGSISPYRPSRPLHGSPQKISSTLSYGSQTTDSYKSPSSSKGSSTYNSRPPSIPESLPSHGSPPKKSHRPLYDSESTDSYKSPSSSYSSASHGSRSPSISESSSPHRPSHGSSSSDSYWSHNPVSDSPSNDSTRTSYDLPSNLDYEAPSGTVHESLHSGQGDTVGATHTFVKTDHHGNVKWGVRHSVDNKYAGSHH